MRIAFTGASSTGKTTLVRRLMELDSFRAMCPRVLGVDARALLQEFAVSNVDQLDAAQYARFQVSYIIRKSWIERDHAAFVTERSFLDCASYWHSKVAPFADPRITEFVRDYCIESARKFDLHVFCPTGLLPVKLDGWRSVDMAHHRDVDALLRKFLSECCIRHVTLDALDIDWRIDRVMAALQLSDGSRT